MTAGKVSKAALTNSSTCAPSSPHSSTKKGAFEELLVILEVGVTESIGF